MNNKKIATKLKRIAKSLSAVEFPSQEAMNKYLKLHPLANRRNHSVSRFPASKNSLYPFDTEKGRLTNDGEQITDDMIKSLDIDLDAFSAHVKSTPLNAKDNKNSVSYDDVESWVGDNLTDFDALDNVFKQGVSDDELSHLNDAFQTELSEADTDERKDYALLQLAATQNMIKRKKDY